MLYLYYKRLEYMLEFDLNGANGVINSLGVKYGEALAGKEPEESDIPEYDGYKFEGWFWNAEGLGEEVNWSGGAVPLTTGTTVKVFAKWMPNSVKVQFFDGLGGTLYSDEDEFTSPGGTIVDPQIVYVVDDGSGNSSEYPLVAGQVVPGKGIFRGWIWLVDDKFPANFVFDITPITVDQLEVYATWEVRSYQITYDAGLGSGEVPVDENRYSENQYARIKDGSRLTPPSSEYVFYGWDAVELPGQTPDSVLSYPYNLHKVTADLELRASYGLLADSAKLVFHPVIYGTTPSTEFSYYRKKSEDTPLGSSSLFMHPEQELIGWVHEDYYNPDEESDASEAKIEAGVLGYYEPEEMFNPGAEAEIHFYAIWQVKKHTVRFVAGSDGSLNDEDTWKYNNIRHGTLWMDTSIVVPTEANGGILPDPGFRFDRWSATSFPERIYDSLTYTAYFVRATYEISFRPGTQGTWDYRYHRIRDLVYGDDHPQPSVDPSLASNHNPGWYFVGWDTNGDNTAEYAPGTEWSEPVTSSVIYTAIWRPNTTTPYMIEHYLIDYGAEEPRLALASGRLGTTGTEASAAPQSFEGYTHNSSYTGTVQQGTIAGDGSLVLRLYYQQDVYTVRFINYDGSVISGQFVPYDGSAVAPEDPSRAGYTFSGWSRGFTNVRESFDVLAQYQPIEQGVILPPPAPTPLVTTPAAPVTGSANTCNSNSHSSNVKYALNQHTRGRNSTCGTCCSMARILGTAQFDPLNSWGGLSDHCPGALYHHTQKRRYEGKRTHYNYSSPTCPLVCAGFGSDGNSFHRILYNPRRYTADDFCGCLDNCSRSAICCSSGLCGSCI